MPCDNGEYGKLGQPMFLHRLLSIVAICTEESGLLSFGRIASVLAKVVASMLLICIKPLWNWMGHPALFYELSFCATSCSFIGIERV
jgi:hypothetical protein